MISMKVHPMDMTFLFNTFTSLSLFFIQFGSDYNREGVAFAEESILEMTQECFQLEVRRNFNKWLNWLSLSIVQIYVQLDLIFRLTTNPHETAKVPLQSSTSTSS